DLALCEMKETRAEHHQPRVLLARAAVYRLRGEWDEAAADLAVVWEIAVRGGMEIFKADFLLESSRLHLARGDAAAARECFLLARSMVRQMEYHRRRADVEQLASALVVGQEACV